MEDPKEFDRYASSYSDLHRESIRLSGEEPSYFAQRKVDFAATTLRAARYSPRSVLDFGCGIGGTLPHLKQAFPKARIAGSDVSAVSLEMAAKQATGVDLGLITDGRIPIDDFSVDVAVAACVFHHIPIDERRHWMAELKRVLVPGGYLFIFEHNPYNPLTLKVVRDCPFDEDAVLLPPHETRVLFREAGFRDIERDFTLFFPHALRALRGVEPALAWCPLGAQYAVHGRA